MLRYLGRKFWARLLLSAVAMGVIAQGPAFFRPAAQALTDLSHSDQVQTSAASSQGPSEAAQDLARRLTAYYDTLEDDSEGHRWRWLSEEWMALGEQWFARVFPGDTVLHTRYATLWITKRERIRQWRLDCRREFFPEFSDEELYARASWFREQEEWREMQAKVGKGEADIEAQYERDLTELLGPKRTAFDKLHALYVNEQLGAEAVRGLFL